MTARPPSRYRVVEQGRRLLVVDRWQEEGRPESVTPSHAPKAETPSRPSFLQRPRQTRFDGTADLTTHPFYDDKAPRTIQLDPGSAAIIGRAKLIAIIVAVAFVILAIAEPVALALPVLLFQNGVRKPIRAAITKWLDRVEREAS